MKFDAPLTADLLRRLLRYEPETGRLFWLLRTADMFVATKARTAAHECARWNARYAGREAFTTVNSKGYLKGEIFDRAYLAHRVIWCLVRGVWPSAMLDHRDTVRTNNRFQNLREATRDQNARNRRSQGGTSQFLGVHRHGRKWQAAIRSHGSKTYLGSFNSEEAAARAYDAAARQRHGDFAHLNFPEAV